MGESTKENAAIDKKALQKNTSFEEFMAFLKSDEGKKYIREFFYGSRHGIK